MAEQSSGERTEQATQRKIDNARKKGQVPRSKELTTACLLVASPVMLMMSFDSISEGFANAVNFSLSVERKDIFNDKYMTEAIVMSIYEVFTSFSLFFLVLYLIGILTPLLLGGMTLSVEALNFKGNRLSPLSGFKRMFGTQAGMELIKSIGKFSLVAAGAWLVISFYFEDYLRLGVSSPQHEVSISLQLILQGLLLVSLFLFIIAFIDMPFQIWNHSKQLKMTKQEVKDEYKETEGKPEVKSRIRQLQREYSNRRMMESVPDADVVVTNPEHFSVAIKYRPQESAAPIVVARGADLVAFNIRKVAIAHKVPIVEAPPLARALFYTTEVDDEIHPDLYLAVAQLLAYVFQLEAYKKGQSKKPSGLETIELPDNMKY